MPLPPRLLTVAIAVAVAAPLPGQDAAGPDGPDLDAFREEIEPVLSRTCYGCHGESRQRGGLRLDTLDPDLYAGEDVDVWLDVQSVLSNGEMPPPDEVELAGADRGLVIEWLATEVQGASLARRSSGDHSSLRRMTRYEYEYVLQDLLGQPYRFADDLPPDPVSEDGFQNSSDALHLTAAQLGVYLEAGRQALRAVTVEGERPTPLVWDLSMDDAAAFEWAKLDAQIADLENKHAEDPDKLAEELRKRDARLRKRPGRAHYEDLGTGHMTRQTWGYNGARFAWAPAEGEPLTLERDLGPSDRVAVIPRRQGLIVELGERIPDVGVLRVRLVASRAGLQEGPPPSLRLDFGWQASNDSRAVFPSGEEELIIDAPPGAPEVYGFDLPLPNVELRNWLRRTAKMGATPSPSEYIKLVNASLSGDAVRVHHVQVAALQYDAWPPASHRRVFPESEQADDEGAYAAEVLAAFLPRALRRDVSATELQRKLALFEALRPDAATFEDAMLEVLSTVLASPQFLYVGVDTGIDDGGESDAGPVADTTLATRLALFLWCSTPDDELLQLARRGALAEPQVLSAQVERMLADPRARRFSKHFVRQWLGMSLLDFLHIDKKAYPHFDRPLKVAIEEEPVAFFHELLESDHSVLAFLESDFTMANERLAQHYGVGGVTGNAFQRVSLADQPRRGGLLTQAGLLAMNSDGTDSHPLKRGVWLLKSLLNDPPPPPPPAVPEIDLTDPEIAKMTLKERIEDHRNHPACMSCHAKIDPWGIAFEQYDAVGSFREAIRDAPVDARSVLFNGQVLEGMEGLKAFLLENRQDQFVRALVHNLATFALGRPLAFEDRAAIDQITSAARTNGDGLATIVTAIATSDLFRSR